MKELFSWCPLASLRRSSTIAEMWRGFPYGYTLGFALFLAPFTQACGDDIPCTASATCPRVRTADDGGAELDATSDSFGWRDAAIDVGDDMTDADGGIIPLPGDGGSTARDTQSEDRNQADDSGHSDD